jgi:hypothetical protein
MPAAKDGQSVKEDLRVLERDDGSAIVGGAEEHHPSGESREDDDDFDGVGAAGGHESGANANGEPDEAAELAQAETDEDRAAIRERRRQERADKKRRAAERVEKLEADLAQQRQLNADIMQRMGAFERRASSTDMAQIDDALRGTHADVQRLQAAIERGTTSGDGKLVSSATVQLHQTIQRQAALTNAKQAYVQQEQQRQFQATQPAGPDPRVIANARAWASRNTWYDPAGGNEESAIVRALDQQLEREGLSPTSPSYFEELDRRIARRLPERSGGKVRANAQGKPSGSARVAGSGSESTGSGGQSAKGYTLSPARVQALKDAGSWDDPARRAKAIESYRKYDREHGSTR